MVKNRDKLHHEKPCKEKCKDNNFEQNPHEEIATACNKKAKTQAMICAFGNISATDENDFVLAQWYIRHWIAKFSANVSHPSSLHAVWKTV